MQIWKRLKSSYIIQTPYMNLRQDACQLPDGTHIDDYYVLEESDYGMVFALTTQQELVMVRQYKHGIGEVMLELPAGYLNPDDANPATGCWREFREETGYDAPTYTLVGTHVRHPTRATNRGHLVVATAAYKRTHQELDPNEAIEVVLMPITQVFEAIHHGHITAVGTVASIFFAWDHLKRTGQVQEG